MIYVATGSMEPTLYIGGHYLINRMVYRFHDPERGDIVALIDPVDGETGDIKRVIAIGGDRVELREKKVYVNGKLLNEPYTIHKRAGQQLIGDTLGPLTVPEGHCFVLGDNRDVSMDSSYWTNPKTHEPIYFIPYSSIKGRLILIS